MKIIIIMKKNIKRRLHIEYPNLQVGLKNQGHPPSILRAFTSDRVNLSSTLH